MIGLWSLVWSTPAAAVDCGKPEVRYDGKTFTATFCTEGGWAGATLRRASDGVHFDLPAVEVRGPSTTVTGVVGPGFVQYVLGNWSDKSPCTTGRHGCTAYGYELESVMWSFPASAYEYDGEHRFADFEPMRVRVMDAGGGAALTGKIRQHLPSVPFAGGGGAPQVVDGGAASSPRTEVEILYRGRWDRIRAWQIASALRKAQLGARWTVKHWPEAPDAFVIAVGAP